MDAEYAYRFFKDDSILPKKIVQPNNKPFPSIFVELRLCKKLKKLVNGNTGGDDAVVELLSFVSPFCFSHVRFFNIEEKRRFVSFFLACLCLPDSVQDSVIDEMFQFARSMLDDDENAGLEVLPFVMDVAVTILQMPGESEDDVIARAGDRMQ